MENDKVININNKGNQNIFAKGSYAEVVQKNMVSSHQKLSEILRSRNSEVQSQNRIFFTYLAKESSVLKIWKTFKQLGMISNIILPSKRDKFGNIFGFIVAANHNEAKRIINRAGTIKFGGVPIKMD